MDGIGAWCLARVWSLRSVSANSSRENLVVALYVLVSTRQLILNRRLGTF